ncbi:MAG: pyridoxal phosphate-dependent aminotransferase [Bacteroidales bacterium]|nr:pyridoxal phosphate-dependent aminotransferase [Bacteroidales bacterium]
MSVFDAVIPRKNTSSVKWDGVPSGFAEADMEGVIPMWVADMDFKAAPCILEALKAKLDHGVFGYTRVPENYYRAEMEWFGRRHGWKIEREWIRPIGGLVPAASVAIRALTQPGDEVVVQVPAYNCFFRNVTDTGCVISENRLLYEDGKYSIDFEDFENRCRTAKVFLLCNPHNPTGRLWTREELEKMGDICLSHGVKVISDEIHCDIVPPGSSYTPFATIKDSFAQNSICFNSPTKCFNIAGLLISNIVSANADMLKEVDRVICEWEHRDLNQFGVAAFSAAFSAEGEKWLDAMNAYIHENYLYLKERLARELPECPVLELEATYLVWMDCSALPVSTGELERSLIREEKVWVNGGGMYGDDSFVRINIACPRATLEQGLDRIVRGIRKTIDNK